MKTAPVFALTFILCASILAQTPVHPSIGAVARRLESGAAPVRVVCFGDSITGVYYHTGSRRAWTDLLGLALQKAWPAARVEMINAGVSGHTTANALARIERDVIAKKPHLVAVMFGMNDVVRTPPGDYEKNLAEIAARCARAGAAVVFCTPNSVTENPQRSNAKLAESSAAMRRVAAAGGWPLADAFTDWEATRAADPTAWTLRMSESIHPDLNGHRRFAELIAGALAGREIALTGTDAPPAPDPLANTLGRLKAGQPVKIVALPPHDRIVPDMLRKRFPGARLEVYAWPAGEPWNETGRAASKGFAKTIRDMRPHLVVVAPPATMLTQPDEAGFVGDAQWMLNFAFPFATREWDVIAALPDTAGPGLMIDPRRVAMMRAMIAGKDLAPLARPAGDTRPIEQWIESALFP